ncbi:MAG: sodium:calcium antiporter [Patescibacteria group bacterium]|jgi:cation:H+ antiporter
MIENFLILIASLFFVVKGATLATKYSVFLAESCRLSKYVIGFIVVTVISILPETFISISSALEGEPSIALGTLFGSNVADLTLVFAIIIFFSGRSIKIQSSILKNNIIFPLLLLVPMILGLNGHFSRLEGLALIIVGSAFYFLALKNDTGCSPKNNDNENRFKNFILLLTSMAILLIASHFTVISAMNLAHGLGVKPILIGLFIISLGTIIPELLFSLKAVKKNHDSLAMGDLLGTVLADATIVVGILSLLTPLYFPPKIIYVTGSFMVLASCLLVYFMHTGRVISKKEGKLLFLFWLIFILTELLINK